MPLRKSCPIYHLLKRLKKYIAREWELKQCLKTIKLVVTILVSAKANEIRLNNLILLISISYTISSFQVQKVKNKGVQEYISRTNEKGRKERRHSSFFCRIIYDLLGNK